MSRSSATLATDAVMPYWQNSKGRVAPDARGGADKVQSPSVAQPGQLWLHLGHQPRLAKGCAGDAFEAGQRERLRAHGNQSHVQ